MTTSGPIPLDQSATFNALVARVTALEAGSTAAGLTLGNNTFVNTRLVGGSLTRAFGLNSTNNLIIGGIDQTISSVVFEVAQTPVATFSAGSSLFLQPLQVGDTNFGLNFNSGTQPFLAFDNGDNFSYVRSTNTFVWNVANSAIVTIGATGNFTTSGNVVASGLSVSVGGGKGSAAVNPGDTTHSGSFVILGPSGSQFGAVGPMTATSTLGIINNLGTGFLFTGGPSYFDDSIFNAGMVGGNPTIGLDTGDAIRYDRAANKFYFIVGGVNVASIDASGNMKLLGTLTQSTTP